MKILFLTTQSLDYLQDSLLIGLREVLKDRLIDYPKKDCMYKGYQGIEKLYGKGFTLYALLKDIEINRESINEKIINNEFDYIIFSSIHRQIKLLKELFPLVKNKNLIFIDGEDHPAIFPYNGTYWRNFDYWFLPKVHKKYLYFKREYTTESIYYRFYKLISKSICKRITLKNVKPISFSFPSSKIITIIPFKEKTFPEHIVDLEVAKNIKKQTKYVFNKEIQYFEDIQKSKYGITTKRSGWDCMRHYEIAANGTVPCFKLLDEKPDTCAPHGLNNSNCIIYKDFQDLKHKLINISDDEYAFLQKNSLIWARCNSTENRAKEVINAIENHFNKIRSS